MKSIPLILVTGFLGSGKTSFLANYLSAYSKNQKIGIVQNEFAQSNIDSNILREDNSKFVLRELDRGSIFCTCLFSSFKDTLVELSEKEDLDVVLVEATGIADPIAIAQVMEDERVKRAYYLEKIITLVDSCRFLNVLENIIGVRHQIEVADYILINKADLIDQSLSKKIIDKIEMINPFAKLIQCSYGKFSPEDLTENDMKGLVSDNLRGELTRCGEGNYMSGIFKTSKPVSLDKVNQFLASLDNYVLRVKGYIRDSESNCYMIQYVPGQIQVLPCNHTIGNTELISIGFKEPDFSLLQ